MAGRRYLLRVRGLKTNFYTYEGVVKALDDIDLDVVQGETIGIVGETGCGKSVAALSILRLIPQPPGKIEAGEALVDVSEEEVAEISALRAEVRAATAGLLGKGSSRPDALLTLPKLDQVVAALAQDRQIDPPRKQELRARISALRGKLAGHDLLALPEDELRDVRGNVISMIFQEPMQALNPVYPVGDQIAESIILHRRRWLTRRIVLRMRTEVLRKGVLGALQEQFRGRPLPVPGVELGDPSPSDLRIVLVALEAERARNERLVRPLRELLAFEALLKMGGSRQSVYSRYLPKAFQRRQYEGECLRIPWQADDVADELSQLAFVAKEAQGPRIPWIRAEASGRYDVVLTPASGLSAKAASEELRKILTDRKGLASVWSFLEKIVDPPRVENDRILLSVKEEHRRTSLFGREGFVSRVPVLKRWVRHPRQRQAMDEAAEVLRLLNIPDPQRVATMYPHELSGGMNQRAMIAIALACDPMLLIADEPTTALDVTIQAQILDLLRGLKAKGRPSILIITHDLGVIAEMCDKVCVMYAGHIIERASVREIFKNPLHPYTKGLLEAIPSHAQRKERLAVIKGSVPNLIYPPTGCRFHPRCPAVLPHCGWDSRDLEAEIRSLAAAGEMDSHVITAVDLHDPFMLRISFRNGDEGARSMEAIRAKVEGDRPSSVLLQAVTEVKQEGSDLVFTLLKTRRPRDTEVSPGHMVSCYLYEPWPEVA